MQPPSVSTVYDGPGRSSSSRLDGEAARCPRSASSTIASRCSPGGDRPGPACAAARRPARTATRSSPSASAASSATARCATWIGSNVPPKTPSDPGTTRRTPSLTRAPRAAPPTRARWRRCGPCRPAATPARRSSVSMPRRARSRWKRSADSSTSKLVWAAIRSIRAPRTRNAPSASRSTAEAVAHRPRSGGRRRPAGSGGSASSAASGRMSATRARNASSPSPVAAEIATASMPVGRARAPERRPGLGGRGQVDLVERDEHRLLEQRRVVRPQLVADDVVVPLGVARRAVDDVDEDPRPLDVAQERVAEAGPAAGALDEPGDVGDRRPALVARRRGPSRRGSARGS